MNPPVRALQDIVIIGDGLRAALPAAYLAARCRSSGSRIHVVPTNESGADRGSVFARPNIRHLHQLLKIPEKHIFEHAQGQWAYAVDIQDESQKITTPFGSFGGPYKGVAFPHLHTRLAQNQPLPSLSHFNLNLRLHEMGDRAPFFPKANYGYIFPRASYTGMLRHYAKANGASFRDASFIEVLKDKRSGRVEAVKTSGDDLNANCIIDVTFSRKSKMAKQAGWIENCLYVDAKNDWPGMELFRLQAAMERLSAFMPDNRFNVYELNEYNRLTRLEEDRIAGMRAFVAEGVSAGKSRPALQRKIDVFCNRGRIPIEDYEVFTSPEWRAVLMSKGLVPKYYDRLADAMSDDELGGYIEASRQDIDVKLRSAQALGRRSQ